MSEPICISYTPSREYADAMIRDRNIVDRRGYGMTPGDTWHLGLRSYDVIDRFAKAREPEERQPITCSGWREKIDKAKADIAASNVEWAIRDAAEKITDDEFDVWLNTITKGQNEYANNNH